MNEPLSYTKEEGGPWISWAEGGVDGRALKRRGKTNVEINGVQVHSLMMGDGREWDCINGWRSKPVSEAMIDAPEMVNGVMASFSGANAKNIAGESITGPIQVYEAPFPDLRPVAQAYALRVWNGQSITTERNWRIARVMEALEGQNLPTDGVELP